MPLSVTLFLMEAITQSCSIPISEASSLSRGREYEKKRRNRKEKREKKQNKNLLTAGGVPAVEREKKIREREKKEKRREKDMPVVGFRRARE